MSNDICNYRCQFDIGLLLTEALGSNNQLIEIKISITNIDNTYLYRVIFFFCIKRINNKGKK